MVSASSPVCSSCAKHAITRMVGHRGPCGPAGLLASKPPERAQTRHECATEGCPATFTEHKWGSTRAHLQGWFLQHDGQAWCPEHVPEWVAEWRARKQASKEQP